MKITFLTPGYCWAPSGGIRIIYEHANQLVAKGHEVTVVHPRRLKYLPPPHETTSLYRKVRGLTTSVRELLVRPSIDWHPIDSRVKLLYVPTSDASYLPDADAIFATSWQTVRSVVELPARKGEKFHLIQGYETFMGPAELVDESWRAPLHKAAVSKWLLEVGARLGCHDIAYVPNAIDATRYRVMTPIGDRSPRVAMTFSKAPIKGAADGIEALKIARAKYPRLQAVLFGLAHFRPPVPNWIEYSSNPSQDRIVREIYNPASILLSPSWSEGYALPPAEAAACGCAIVASDSGGLRDYVENGVTGMLSQPKDPAALAANLCLLLRDHELRMRLARAGHDQITCFSPRQSTIMLESYIVSVLSRARVSPSAAPLIRPTESVLVL